MTWACTDRSSLSLDLDFAITSILTRTSLYPTPRTSNCSNFCPTTRLTDKIYKCLYTGNKPIGRRWVSPVRLHIKCRKASTNHQHETWTALPWVSTNEIASHPHSLLYLNIRRKRPALSETSHLVWPQKQHKDWQADVSKTKWRALWNIAVSPTIYLLWELLNLLNRRLARCCHRRKCHKKKRKNKHTEWKPMKSVSLKVRNFYSASHFDYYFPNQSLSIGSSWSTVLHFLLQPYVSIERRA